MAEVEVPDITRWPEIMNARKKIIIQGGESIGAERLFFHYDFKHPDSRFHKLMIRCLAFYLFGNQEVARSWLVYEEENGIIKNTIYSAILVGKDEWVVGKPEIIWELNVDRDESGNLVGVILSLDTDEGVKRSYFAKPSDWQTYLRA